MSDIGSSSEKTVDEKYQKKTHLQHIKDLPDTYIGSIEEVTEPMWVLDSQEQQQQMVLRDITYIPGLYKIFDEILVNASDHKMRCPALKAIKVSVDAASGRISVWNDGSGIDIAVHAETGVYAPELIFGHLLTSGNYDASEKKVTGGRNGYGAKLTNIFSTEFVVETAQGGKKYRQCFRNNMTVIEPPVITAVGTGGKGAAAAAAAAGYVLIEYVPDYARFGLAAGLTADMMALLTKRVYDLAATTSDINIWFNGTKVGVRGFEKYMELYVGSSKKEVPRVYEEVGERWAIGACTSPDGAFRHISFVNGIWTYKGGKHVEYISDQLARRVTKYINERKKTKVAVKESYVKSNLWVFVRCLVENPAFSSQTKEELVTPSKHFGSKCEVSDDFIEKLAKSGVMDKAVDLTVFKEKDSLKKTDGKKRFTLSDIPKLDDANKAGGSESHKCTLILTEGDSAKASVVSGLSVVGRDYYGVFPLKGKLLNVREATTAQLVGNEEIKQIKKILGLQHYAARDSTQSKEYLDTKELRYGRILIMTDADVDGSHIKGLLINFFHYNWPSLLRLPNFIDTFKTPLVKATKRGQPQQIFYSLNEYEAWKQTLGSAGAASTWEIKYYKGLGTSKPEEFKEYFRDMTTNLVHFHWKDDTTDTDAITLAFKKERSNDRKEWLQAYNADPLGHKRELLTKTPSYSDFVHSELVHFSNYDNIRSIPHLLDGFKPSQRKVLFACLKRHLTKEMKVSQLSGYVSEQTSYHHGETSLQGAIVGMAQTFVGSNNLNVLVPNGQFGTRIKGGDDAASPRYIFTQLNPLTQHVFNEHDAPLLPYLDDDGVSIEPSYYVPILPMVLLNGTNGIGTGFRSKIPCYNPADILRQLCRRLEGHKEPFEPIHPWYNKFCGTIEPVSSSIGGITSIPEEDEGSATFDYRKYVATGLYSVAGDYLTVSELPIGTWTQNYKEFIEACMSSATAATAAGAAAISDLSTSGSTSTTSTTKSKRAASAAAAAAAAIPPILSYENHCTDDKVLFVIKMEKGYLGTLSHQDIITRFKLSKPISTSSMYLYNAAGAIERFNTPEDIMEAFFEFRLEAYGRRKEYMLKTMERKCVLLENKVKFVQCVLDGHVRWNQTQEEMEQVLASLNIQKLNVSVGAATDSGEGDSDYHYLLDMKIRTLTKENVEKLRADYDKTRREQDDLVQTSTVSMWLEDLRAFEGAAGAAAAAAAANATESAAVPLKTSKNKAKPKK